MAYRTYSQERLTSYIADGRLEAVELRRDGLVQERFTYENYDLLGNPRTMTSGEGTTQVTYDDRSQAMKLGIAWWGLANKDVHIP